MKDNNTDPSSIFPKRYFELFKGKDDNKIRILLIFGNVWQKCKELDEARKDIESKDKKSDKNRTEQDLMSNMYRFPYDVLESFNWDLEHIDSATTNLMQKIDDKESWVKAAEEVDGLKDDIKKDPIYIMLKSKFEKTKNEKDIDEMIKQIKIIAGDDTEDDKYKKDWVGNLTLLDCGTNRGYGNSLFVIKHKTIRERINQGVFVPRCTQMVFEKMLFGCSQDFRRWDWDDKINHHNFLLKEYDMFAKGIIEHKTTINTSAIRNNAQEIGE